MMIEFNVIFTPLSIKANILTQYSEGKGSHFGQLKINRVTNHTGNIKAFEAST